MKVHAPPGGPSFEKKGLRFDVKVLRAARQAEPPRAILRGTTNRCSAAKYYTEENHVTVYIELLWVSRKPKVA